MLYANISHAPWNYSNEKPEMGVFLSFCPLFSINCHIFIVNSSNIITISEVLVDFHVITFFLLLYKFIHLVTYSTGWNAHIC